MKNFNIKYQDAYDLERLIKICINIENIYKKLYSLEIDNKKEDIEYKKYMHYLSLLINGEKDFDKEVNLSPSKALSWVQLLSKAQNSSLETNFNNQIIKRIKNKLLNIVCRDYNFLNNLSNNDLENILKLLGMRFKENTFNKQNILYCIIIKFSIEKDINYTFLSFLEEQIKLQKMESIKEKLITSKYYMIYTHKDIEMLTLENEFNIGDISYVSSRITKDILDIEDSIYINSNNLIGSTIAKAQIYELLEISDLEYDNLIKVTTSILCQCMLNSSLLFVDDTTINYVKNDLDEFINQSEYKSIHENSSISKAIINYCLNNVDKNRTKIKMLSLK